MALFHILQTMRLAEAVGFKFSLSLSLSLPHVVKLAVGAKICQDVACRLPPGVGRSPGCAKADGAVLILHAERGKKGRSETRRL